MVQLEFAPAKKGMILHCGKILGEGGYGAVCSATDHRTGRVVALKKARVSLSIKRPVLYYEATMLRLLEGHQAIPRVFGYGRKPHFEYLALELFEKDVRQLAEESEDGMSLHAVCDVAIQMVCVLHFLSPKGLILPVLRPRLFA